MTRGGWTRNGGALQCGCDMDEELRFVGGGWWGRSWQRTKELRMYEIGEFFVFLYFFVASLWRFCDVHDTSTELALFGRLDFRARS